MNHVRVRNTETGAEFGLNTDCFQHGYASRKIGMARNDNPFTDTASDEWNSWNCGYRAAELGEQKDTLLAVTVYTPDPGTDPLAPPPGFTRVS